AGRLSEAIAKFREIVAIDSLDPKARTDLGVALAQAGDRKGAIEQLTEALQIAPGNAGVRYNLGVIMAELGAEQEAIEHFQAATRSDPQLTRAHFQLGNLLMRRGRYSEAPAEYAAVIRMEPRNGFARLMEAMALIRLKKYSEARDRLEQSMAALPTDLDLRTSMARLLAACPDESIRNGPKALELVQQVLQNGKSFDLEQGQTLAMALAAVGQFQQAAQVQGYMIAELQRAQQSELAQLLQVNLTLYQRAQP